VGRLHTLGFPLAWEALQAEDGRCVSLPAYQWQRERFWLKEQETRNDRRTRHSADEFRDTTRRSLVPPLGRCMRSATEPETYHWEFALDPSTLPLLSEHRVQE